jgi:hypothetical protein
MIVQYHPIQIDDHRFCSNGVKDASEKRFGSNLDDLEFIADNCSMMCNAIQYSFSNSVEIIAVRSSDNCEKSITQIYFHY